MLFFIILIASLIISFVLPWWIIALVSFLAAFWIARGTAHAFWSAFAAIFIVWAVVALFKSVPNNHILATRVSHLFFLPHWSLLLLITSLIGGLVAGMSALSGVMVRRVFKK
jgi:predicted lysophospholipase L1 biosynthesis ABC-type transport system permease subunit